LLRADYVFRAVLVPQGVHEVEFVYHPRSFTISKWISGLSWLGCALAIGFGFVAMVVRRRRVA
jgi:hypothetical protein